MRMLSSMTAGLRNRANELRMFAKAMNAPYILPETKESARISMRNAAVELEHAADTIDELRGMCADLYDHVDELKALAQRLYYCGQRDRECDRCGMNGADMHVKMSDVDYCDGINMCIRDLGIEVSE